MIGVGGDGEVWGDGELWGVIGGAWMMELAAGICRSDGELWG